METDPLNVMFIWLFFHILHDIFSCVKTAEEINENLNGFKMEEHADYSNHTLKLPSGASTPASVDWRKSGLVGPVRNQVRF